jgi:MerR family transcriptional regulator, light-induced transcriptional regulator
MQARDDQGAYLRIGELSRRVGVSSELLRAWERRYGLMLPARTPGGFRLYRDEDEQRVRRMLSHLAAGASAAEAARIALAEDDGGAPDGPRLLPLAEVLRPPLDRYDEAGAHLAFDGLLAKFTLETVLRDAVLPYLGELGDRWERGEASVAQEHFASAFLRGRLLGLARGWDGGRGPRVLLAAAPGDQHDLGLICFGLALRGHGWRITFLGADTPLATATEAARLLSPRLVVVTFTTGVDIPEAGLAELAGAAPLALAGRGASAGLAHAVGARHLAGDPLTAATVVAGGRLAA